MTQSGSAGAPGPGTWILALAVVLAMAGVFRDAPDSDPEVAPVRVTLTPASPVRVAVPAVGLRARVVPIEVNPEGVLHPPEDVDLVGWWKRSAKPGLSRGQTVLTGHTVSNGGGVMDRLGELTPGDRVRVRTREGTVRYAVTRKVEYSRAELAGHSSRLFGQDRDEPRLVLITCTDWDGEDYLSNIVVFAEPTQGSVKDEQREPNL